MKQAVSTALFSATLSPMEYYADVCGCKNAVKLELPSPYERENLCLVTVDSVSTRLSSRMDTSADVAELITAVTESREGNYIVYFPSYKYMNAVCRQYLKLSPGSKVILQKQGMSIGERDRFLRAFSASAARGEGLTAFCVLGGIFSEGIDLQGESLIGSIIVGIGLPGLSSELNILSEYYDKTRESGHDYAYLYPAMNKILQAAGRVIRSEEDRGAVVLIDDRYADPGIRKLFPAHWSRMQYTGDAYSLSRILEKFWET
jgi:DNA excision repair protein ERCC-2